MTQEHARETCANWNWAHTFHLPLVFIVRKYLVLRWVTKSSHVLKNYDEPPEKIAPHTRQKTQVSVENVLEWKKKVFWGGPVMPMPDTWGIIRLTQLLSRECRRNWDTKVLMEVLNYKKWREWLDMANTPQELLETLGESIVLLSTQYAAHDVSAFLFGHGVFWPKETCTPA